MKAEEGFSNLVGNANASQLLVGVWIAVLFWVDDGNGEVGRLQPAGQVALQPACCLHYDQVDL